MRLRTLFALACGAFLAAPAAAQLRLATTTSTEDSGLLSVLLPKFETSSGVKVRVFSTGSGRAMKMAQNGEVDVLLVHSRVEEEQFVAAGWGLQRRDVMYNDFVIVGPAADPASIRGMRNALAAFRRIIESGAPFVSRGDQSGTHMREEELWRQAGRTPPPRQYISAADGMGAVLLEASNLRAYTLSDRATYSAFRTRINLDLLVEGDPSLHIGYGVIAVNPARHASVNHRDALRFIDWITGAEGRRAITEFRVNGQQLFFPIAR